MVGFNFFKRYLLKKLFLKIKPSKIATSQFKKLIPGGRQQLTVQDAGNQEAT
jgi:hypothetical protein